MKEKFKYKKNTYKWLGDRDFLIFAGENGMCVSSVTDEDVIDVLLDFIEKGI